MRRGKGIGNKYKRKGIHIKQEGDGALKIINIIHVGDDSFNYADLPEDKKAEISQKLNDQALSAIGYRKVKDKDKTA